MQYLLYWRHCRQRGPNCVQHDRFPAFEVVGLEFSILQPGNMSFASATAMHSNMPLN